MLEYKSIKENGEAKSKNIISPTRTFLLSVKTLHKTRILEPETKHDQVNIILQASDKQNSL